MELVYFLVEQEEQVRKKNTNLKMLLDIFLKQVDYLILVNKVLDYLGVELIKLDSFLQVNLED